MKAVIIILIILLVLSLLYLLCRRGYGDWEHFCKWRYAHRGFHDREKAEAAGNLVIFENFDPRG